jgi:hypothetical protein
LALVARTDNRQQKAVILHFLQLLQLVEVAAQVKTLPMAVLVEAVAAAWVVIAHSVLEVRLHRFKVIMEHQVYRQLLIEVLAVEEEALGRPEPPQQAPIHLMVAMGLYLLLVEPVSLAEAVAAVALILEVTQEVLAQGEVGAAEVLVQLAAPQLLAL